MKEIPEIAWNFDDVPEAEVEACCLWEYARESIAFGISSLDHAETLEALRDGNRCESKPDPEYEAFLAAYWNSDEGYMKFYETIRNHGGPAALPWLEIEADVRAQMCKEVGVHEVSQPLAPAMRCQLEALWKANLADWDPVRSQPGYDPDDDGMAYEACGPFIDRPGHAGEPHGETVVAFSVDFRKFSDKEICDMFTAWVKANRPKTSPGPTRRGKKLRDQRVALDRLGMMRLLHHYSLREMPVRCKEAWRAFAGYDWYKERKRALLTYRNLFPFLPPSERPLSWATRGGRSK